MGAHDVVIEMFTKEVRTITYRIVDTGCCRVRRLDHHGGEAEGQTESYTPGLFVESRWIPGKAYRPIDGDELTATRRARLAVTCNNARAMTVHDLPRITPSFAPQPEGVAWPIEQWPRGTHPQQANLDLVVDQIFTNDELAATNAVVVIQGGRVLVERYAGEREFFDRPAEPITASSPLLSWSMAKSMLHMIIGTLVDEGRLDPDQLAPVPEWRDQDDPRHQIRLRDLLAMRDGLGFVEVYEVGQPSDVIEMLFGQGKEDTAAYTARVALAHEPGTFFNYSSGTSNLLSRIVADVVGYADTYRDYLARRLFSPLGMKSAEATFDDTGVWVASSFVHATALDFAKFGLLYLRGGEWNGSQLVTREWAATAQTPLSLEEESGSFYSWQWWVTGDQYGTYWASGYEGQMISVVPALDALVLRFGHTPAENYPALYAWRARVLDVLSKDYAPS
jgi:CubicO group peptidase (beta-lactamase class C family)